jgi:hypothetical protein
MSEMQIDVKEFIILMSTLNQALCSLSDGRQENPHCMSYGMVAVMGNSDGSPDESYYVLFNAAQPNLFKVEQFENTENLKSGQMVYFYNDKAEAIVQSTLRGESDNFFEVDE